MPYTINVSNLYGVNRTVVVEITYFNLTDPSLKVGSEPITFLEAYDNHMHFNNLGTHQFSWIVK